MSALSLLLNILWIVFGGLYMAIGWVIAAVLMAITIVGLPWTRAAFNIASYTLLPFGQKAVSRAQYSGSADVGTGPLGVVGNIVWLVLAGWWLALGHLITAILLAVTIVGIPFAWAHLKLAGIALWPIGKMIDLTVFLYQRERDYCIGRSLFLRRSCCSALVAIGTKRTLTNAPAPH